MSSKKLCRMALVVITSLSLFSCREPEVPVIVTPFQVSLSKTSIEANGVDQAVFTATFDQQPLSAEQVVVMDAKYLTAVDMPNLTFTTTEVGTYSFFLTHTDANNVMHSSRTFTIEAEAEKRIDLNDNAALAGVTLEYRNINRQGAMLVARQDGKVVANEEVEFFDRISGSKLEVSTMEYVDLNATTAHLPYWVPTREGEYEIVAKVGGSESSCPLKARLVGQTLLTLPIDNQPANTDFFRRTFMQEYTSVNCNSCPYVTYSVAEVFKDSYYKEHTVLAAIHVGLGGVDPMMLEAPYSSIEEQYGYIYDYPAIWTDMRDKAKSSYCKPEYISTALDKALSYGASEAGICTDVAIVDNTIEAYVGIKAAANNTFRIGAWVVENNIYAEQRNICPFEGDYDNHNHVVRLPYSQRSSTDFTGHDLATLQAADEVTYHFSLPMSDKWVAENCQLILFVTSQNGENYYVTNVVETESLNDRVEYGYNN